MSGSRISGWLYWLAPWSLYLILPYFGLKSIETRLTQGMSKSAGGVCVCGGGGGSGVAKVSCILRHRGVQLILAYSWARPAILVACKGRGECFYFFFLFTFIPVPLSSLSLSFSSSTISSSSFLPFSGKRHKMTHKGWRVVKPQHNQSKTSAGPVGIDWVGLKFYGPVDQNKVMSSRSVCLTPLFLGRVSLLSC